ncbi:3-isopropylmalate dehydratase small subunit [Evansella sp. LMS18]|uniref:3-isopropylmalate dehydratase small subunit n=1 Tax=Evansella sp. LMS18 TaxID=2924033 RepID=UPI0020D1CD30|nr:3-isopropylmalate dehydratase small subunit [Evansella sp. LMS18]UTR09147.1 3-isopropylmalate dehydratase small subunit [Evansella sp. LMS18]
MEPFKLHTGLVCPLNRTNIDTDQIIPKQFLKRIERQGFGEFLFFHWRFEDDGKAKDNFPLNKAEYKGASILAAGENFGCGSSREHAPWALEDYGFKVIIAPSFADIFYNNCFKNGLLPLQLNEEEKEYIVKKAETGSYKLTVDLERQTVSDDFGFRTEFQILPHHKEMLLNGWDEIGVTLNYEAKITEYEQQAAK